MKNPIEATISLIAPHRCVSCSFEGVLLCKLCADAYIIHPPSRCYRCHQAVKQSQVCSRCQSLSPLSHVWVAAEYEEIAKKLIYKLKFDRANAAAEALASALNETLPVLPAEIIVTNVPTADKRVRVRGYDQSRIIAKQLASLRGWRYENLIERRGSSRQVGANRKDRLKQLKDAFEVKSQLKLRGAHILLVDDVLTTGATMEFAARALKDAGATTVDGAVFTQPQQ